MAGLINCESGCCAQSTQCPMHTITHQYTHKYTQMLNDIYIDTHSHVWALLPKGHTQCEHKYTLTGRKMPLMPQPFPGENTSLSGTGL